MKKGKSLRLDHERSLVGVDQAMVLGSDAVARRVASVSQLIHADNKIAAGGVPLNETLTRQAIRLAFTAGSDGAETFMVKPTDAELVSEFAGTADRVRDVGQNPSKIVVKVDIYVTAFDAPLNTATPTVANVAASGSASNYFDVLQGVHHVRATRTGSKTVVADVGGKGYTAGQNVTLLLAEPNTFSQSSLVQDCTVGQTGPV